VLNSKKITFVARSRLPSNSGSEREALEAIGHCDDGARTFRGIPLPADLQPFLHLRRRDEGSHCCLGFFY
jgi:hypothetical protein